MADIFDEIEEDLKRDRMGDAWKKYGNYVYVAIALIIAVTAGYKYWDYHNKTRMVEQANQLDQALVTARSGEVDTALAALEQVSSESDAGYRLLAELRQASLLLDENQTAKAVAIYERIASDDKIDPIYRGLGTVLAVMHADETSDTAVLMEKLAPQLEAGATWRYTALELAAGLALRAGDKDQAIGHIKTIVDAAEAPEGVRARATELLRALEG
ncbi:tetratricopeptide repeat protein [Aestuariispira insulae]|uniref:Ancillary SecYEG translocon subunit/Cell division coordinator CpoB TPR domain-containing protein n=1 Tax=Aestuariispira insulae TaxID=1461337 RepID=A0A3D9HVY6_9PROT|nr:tetratricopeptide repeat protein [Aestuariispira insulae]RED53575.1 hypothetical protein DFP90_101366 [Aestuariispira insulae]